MELHIFTSFTLKQIETKFQGVFHNAGSGLYKESQNTTLSIQEKKKKKYFLNICRLCYPEIISKWRYYTPNSLEALDFSLTEKIFNIWETIKMLRDETRTYTAFPLGSV